jgi:hemoglobin
MNANVAHAGLIMKTIYYVLSTLLLTASSIATAQMPPADVATYQALGAGPGIKIIVKDFIALMLADDRIKESFQDSDLKNLARRLEEQFCQLSGGPCIYKGKDMKEIHDGLNITNAQFNAVAEHLQVAMERASVPSRHQNKLLARLAAMQRTIVTK